MLHKQFWRRVLKRWGNNVPLGLSLTKSQSEFPQKVSIICVDLFIGKFLDSFLIYLNQHSSTFFSSSNPLGQKGCRTPNEIKISLLKSFVLTLRILTLSACYQIKLVQTTIFPRKIYQQVWKKIETIQISWSHYCILAKP